MVEERAEERKRNKREFSAGGIVYKEDAGELFVLMIMPSRRPDSSPDFRPVWTFPKGWVGEKGDKSVEDSALREVREEGGVQAQVIAKLGSVRYPVNWQGGNILKIVTWFLMRYISGDPADHDHEVAEAAWVPINEAMGKLTYPTDKEIFRKALEEINAG